MSLFGSLIRTVVDVAVLPVAVVADMLTGAGAAIERKESYTTTATKKIVKDVKKADQAIDEEDWI